jgi:hypothetical protein
MRYADTGTLQRLNDEAKLANLNQWVKVKFFDDVDWNGRHILAISVPHGTRPKSRRTDWPPHARTLWYVQMANGSTTRVLIDLLNDDLSALPEIPGSPHEEPAVRYGDAVIPPLVVLDDGFLVDGRSVSEAARQRDVGELPALTLPGLDPGEIERLRALIPD